MFTTKLPTTTNEIVDMCSEYSLYTWMPQKNAKPMAIKSGKGCWVYDYDGNKWFDMGSQLVNVNIGHGQQKVIDAIKEQAEKLTFVKAADVTDIRGALSKKIITEFAPKNMKKVLFSLGGADANEFAIRIAKKATGREKIFSQYDAYHGASYGAANLSGEINRGSAKTQIAGFVHFQGPNSLPEMEEVIDFKSEEEKTDYLLTSLRRQMILEGTDTIAAIWFESITGGGGAITPPKGYYEGVRKLCDEFGILMVADEVMAGFGRCGTNFACENYDYLPDIITFAKGVTSGYLPLGGVIVSGEIADKFEDTGMPCGCTYSAHAMSCAAGLATLEVYQEQHLVENCYKMGKKVEAALDEMIPKHPSARFHCGLGLLRGIHFITPLHTQETTAKAQALFKEKGIIAFGRMGSFLIAPPLCVTEEEIDMCLKATDEVLTEIDKLV